LLLATETHRLLNVYLPFITFALNRAPTFFPKIKMKITLAFLGLLSLTAAQFGKGKGKGKGKGGLGGLLGKGGKGGSGGLADMMSWYCQVYFSKHILIVAA
jgi:hypothetical protein